MTSASWNKERPELGLAHLDRDELVIGTRVAHDGRLADFGDDNLVDHDLNFFCLRGEKVKGEGSKGRKLEETMRGSRGGTGYRPSLQARLISFHG